MANTSLAAQAVAQGPATVAPPSFDGHGWLVVVNLAMMTFIAIVALMFAIDAARGWYRNRRSDKPSHPVTLWRAAGACFAMGIFTTRGLGALVLWNWDPARPVETGWYLTVQRFGDLPAMAFGLAGLTILYLSAPGMVGQLRRKPFPIDMWASLPMLKRPACIALLSFVAALGVVSTR